MKVVELWPKAVKSGVEPTGNAPNYLFRGVEAFWDHQSPENLDSLPNVAGPNAFCSRFPRESKHISSLPGQGHKDPSSPYNLQ